MAVKPGVSVTQDRMAQFQKDLKILAGMDVLVGVPQDHAGRQDNEPGAALGNATIAYIQDRGAPEANIPARPFMTPGIDAVKGKIVDLFGRAAKATLAGNPAAVAKAMTAAGLTAQSSIRAVINAGPPPPLKPATIANRKSRGRQSEKPLVDTGQLRNSINFVVRKK